jgi:hypothetical protein
MNISLSGGLSDSESVSSESSASDRLNSDLELLIKAKALPLASYRASKDLSQCTKDHCKFEFFEHKM